jgi:hypothetical protein
MSIDHRTGREREAYPVIIRDLGSVWSQLPPAERLERLARTASASFGLRIETPGASCRTEGKPE